MDEGQGPGIRCRPAGALTLNLTLTLTLTLTLMGDSASEASLVKREFVVDSLDGMVTQSGCRVTKDQ